MPFFIGSHLPHDVQNLYVGTWRHPFVIAAHTENSHYISVMAAMGNHGIMSKTLQ